LDKSKVKTLDANPASHIAAHHFFYKCILQGAIDFAEAAYPRKAWPALHLSLTFSRLPVLKK